MDGGHSTWRTQFGASALQQVVRLRPGLPLAYEWMASCLAHLGRLNEAHFA